MEIPLDTLPALAYIKDPTFLARAQQKLRANVVDRRRGGDCLVIDLGCKGP